MRIVGLCQEDGLIITLGKVRLTYVKKYDLIELILCTLPFEKALAGSDHESG